MKKIFALLWLLPCLAQANDYYVRTTAQGSADGSSWSNAWSLANLQSNFSTLTGGDTVWMAGGTYSGGLQITKSGTSNTSRIVIKRVLSTDSVPTQAAGWNSSFDSQVVINNGTSYSIQWPVNDNTVSTGSNVTIDGQIPEGIRCVIGNTTGLNDCPLAIGLWPNGSNITNVTVANCDLEAPYNIAAASDIAVVQIIKGGSSSSNILITKCKIHGGISTIKIHYANGITFDQCSVGDNANNGGGSHANLVVYNFSGDNTFKRCEFYNWQAVGFEMYGGVYGTLTITGCIFRDSVGGQDAIWPSGTGQTNGGIIKLMNNTFANCSVGGQRGVAGDGSVVPWATGSESRNNICVNGGNSSPNGQLNPLSNWTISNEFSTQTTTGTGSISNAPQPFVSLSTHDLHIVGTIAANKPRDKGANLGALYNVDFDGNTRGADGAWDMGAYEYTVAGADTTPPALTSAVINSAGTQIALTFDEAVQIGAGGSGGWNLSMSGGGTTLSSASIASNVVTYTLSRTVNAAESGSIYYTQPGNGIEDTSSNNNDLLTIPSGSALTVTNNSTQGRVATPTITTASGSYYGTLNVTITDADTASGAVIHYTLDNSVPTSASATYSGPIALTSSATVRAIATKAGSADSFEATPGVYQIGSWTTTANTWLTFSIPSQAGTFTWLFRASVNSAASDTAIGLSASVPAAYTDLATIIQFAPDNTIKARNGANYESLNTVTYTPGTNYDFNVTVSVGTTPKKYSVSVTPEGGSATIIGTDYAFRTEQAAATPLSNFGMRSVVGTATVTNLSFSGTTVSTNRLNVTTLKVQ